MRKLREMTQEQFEALTQKQIEKDEKRNESFYKLLSKNQTYYEAFNTGSFFEFENMFERMIEASLNDGDKIIYNYYLTNNFLVEVFSDAKFRLTNSQIKEILLSDESQEKMKFARIDTILDINEITFKTLNELSEKTNFILTKESDSLFIYLRTFNKYIKTHINVISEFLNVK